MTKGFYVEIIDTENMTSNYVKASCRAEAIDIAKSHTRAQAHEWATFKEGLGDYDIIIADKWQDALELY